MSRSGSEHEGDSYERWLEMGREKETVKSGGECRSIPKAATEGLSSIAGEKSSGISMRR